MILDVHAHLYHPRWYPTVYRQALARDYVRRMSKFGRPISRQTAESIVSRMLTDDTGHTTITIMDRVGIDKRIILVLDWGLALEEAEKSIWDIHREVLSICGRYKDRLVGFAGVDPRRRDAVNIVTWAFDDMGARGLKLHPTSEWRLDDVRTHQVVEVAARRKLPILVHVGRTVDCFSDANAQPKALIDLASAFPGARFVAGHSGFEAWAQFASEPHVSPNIYFDISGWQDLLYQDRHQMKVQLSALLTAFPGRVCFGSDSPFYSYNLITSERSWLATIANFDTPGFCWDFEC